jgi:hypothetical protein
MYMPTNNREQYLTILYNYGLDDLTIAIPFFVRKKMDVHILTFKVITNSWF